MAMNGRVRARDAAGWIIHLIPVRGGLLTFDPDDTATTPGATMSISDHVDYVSPEVNARGPKQSTYDLARDARVLATEACEVPDEPEAMAAFGERLVSWVQQSEDKGEACAYAWRASMSEADHWRAEAKRFIERAERAERSAAFIADCATSLVLAAEMLQGKEGVKVGPLKMQANPPRVVVTDEAALPDRMWNEVTTRSVNKDLIKTAIKAGLTVEGAHLEQGRRITGLK